MTPFDPSQHAFEYVTGTLDAADQRRMEEALAASPLLRRQIDETVEALASTALALPPATPDPSVRRRLLDAIERAERESPERFRRFFAELGRLLALPLEAVRAVVRQIDDPIGWKLIQPGIARLRIAVGAELAGAEATVLRLGPGVRFPHHKHLGAEMALVLEGAGHDADGQTYEPGQLISHAAGSSHDFTAGDDRDLILVVVHHGIKFD